MRKNKGPGKTAGYGKGDKGRRDDWLLSEPAVGLFISCSPFVFDGVAPALITQSSVPF